MTKRLRRIHTARSSQYAETRLKTFGRRRISCRFLTRNDCASPQVYVEKFRKFGKIKESRPDQRVGNVVRRPHSHQELDRDGALAYRPGRWRIGGRGGQPGFMTSLPGARVNLVKSRYLARSGARRDVAAPPLVIVVHAFSRKATFARR